MYDFQFMVVQDADLVRGLGNVRKMFLQEFDGTDAKLKTIIITPVAMQQAEKIMARAAPVMGFVLVAIVESETELIPNSEKNKIKSIAPNG